MECRLYIRRKEGGCGLIHIEDCVRQEELALDEYVQRTEESILEVVAGTLDYARPNGVEGLLGVV